MKFFSKAFTAVAVIAIGVAGAVGQSASVTVRGFKWLTGECGSLQVISSNLNATNIGVQGHQLYYGLMDMAQSVTHVSNEIYSSISETDAEAIYGSVEEFVEDVEKVLDTMIIKAQASLPQQSSKNIVGALLDFQYAMHYCGHRLVRVTGIQAFKFKSLFTASDEKFDAAIDACQSS